MIYYGTELDRHGHYFWNAECDRLTGGRLDHHLYPFDVYEMAGDTKRRAKEKGDCQYQQIKGYSIIGIEGSCFDHRFGTISVFIEKGDLSMEELKAKILSTPITKRIIEKMSFEVKWPAQ
jgi:hypothetical protein